MRALQQLRQFRADISQLWNRRVQETKNTQSAQQNGINAFTHPPDQEATLYCGEDFIFISDEAPRQVITRFIKDFSLNFENQTWEYPNSWSADHSPTREFDTFDAIFNHVLSQETPEFLFYPQGSLSCWFGVGKDKTVVFGVSYSGQSPDALAAFAKQYGGRFGYVAVETCPELEGLHSYGTKEDFLSGVAYQDEDFVLFGDRDCFTKR